MRSLSRPVRDVAKVSFDRPCTAGKGDFGNCHKRQPSGRPHTPLFALTHPLFNSGNEFGQLRRPMREVCLCALVATVQDRLQDLRVDAGRALTGW